QMGQRRTVSLGRVDSNIEPKAPLPASRAARAGFGSCVDAPTLRRDDADMIAVAYNIVSSDDPSRDVRRRIGPDGPWDAYVLNGHGRTFQAHGAGAFSMKWMPRGCARYEVDRRSHRVSRDTVVLLDDGQPYDMEFDARTGGESYCLFFSR